MKRLTLLIDADDTVLDFANSERDSIIALCREYSILSEEKVAENVIFKPISGEKPNPDYNTDDLSNAYESISSNQFVFGSYPQDRGNKARRSKTFCNVC